MNAFAREWTAEYLSRSAFVAQNTRTVKRPARDGHINAEVTRCAITWGDLPSLKGNGMIRMEAAHGHVLQALFRHTPDEDGCLDEVESTASVNQIAMESLYSPSKVEKLLLELELVGWITRKRRMNTSSVTTMYRTPGHHAVKIREAPVIRTETPSHLSNLEHVDVEQVAEALFNVFERFAPGDTDLGTWREQVQQAVDFHTLEGEVFAVICSEEIKARLIGPLNAVLPPGLQVVHPCSQSIGIGPDPGCLASTILSDIKGAAVKMGMFAEGIRSRKDLSWVIWGLLVQNGGHNALIEGIRKATNPAGYFAKALMDSYEMRDATRKAGTKEQTRNVDEHQDVYDLDDVDEPNPDDLYARTLDERENMHVL